MERCPRSPLSFKGHDDSGVEADLQDAKNEVASKDVVVNEMEDQAVVTKVSKMKLL